MRHIRGRTAGRAVLLPAVLTLAVLVCACGLSFSSSGDDDAFTLEDELNNYVTMSTDVVAWQRVKVGNTVMLPAYHDGSVVAVTLINVVDPAPKASLKDEPLLSAGGRAIAFELRTHNTGVAAFALQRSKSAAAYSTSGGGGMMQFRGFVEPGSDPTPPPERMLPGEAIEGRLSIAVQKDDELKAFVFAVHGPDGWVGGWWDLATE